MTAAQQQVNRPMGGPTSTGSHYVSGGTSMGAGAASSVYGGAGTSSMQQQQMAPQPGMSQQQMMNNNAMAAQEQLLATVDVKLSVALPGPDVMSLLYLAGITSQETSSGPPSGGPGGPGLPPSSASSIQRPPTAGGMQP
eukprot:GSA25T00024228001.1